MSFDPKWPHGHVTRDGRKARIVCTDRHSSLPIVALLTDPDGSESVVGFEASGRFNPHEDHRMDLLNAPAPKRKVRVSVWLNVNRNGAVLVCDSRGEADSFDTGRIACIHIVREVEEGEGLSDEHH